MKLNKKPISKCQLNTNKDIWTFCSNIKMQFEATLDEWLKLGVVKRTNSLYNSPLFCVPKKQGQGLRFVQDFRELNNHSHIDKYSMKEITECIDNIGRANSTIFSTLDLTSGFWQMKLDEDSQYLTAFTISGKGQLAWVISPMGF